MKKTLALFLLALFALTLPLCALANEAEEIRFTCDGEPCIAPAGTNFFDWYFQRMDAKPGDEYHCVVERSGAEKEVDDSTTIEQGDVFTCQWMLSGSGYLNIYAPVTAAELPAHSTYFLMNRGAVAMSFTVDGRLYSCTLLPSRHQISLIFEENGLNTDTTYYLDGETVDLNSAMPLHSTLYTTTLLNQPDVSVCTITFDANGGMGIMTPVQMQSGEYILPECRFIAPEGAVFAAWLVQDKLFRPGATINVTGDTLVKALWYAELPVLSGDSDAPDVPNTGDGAQLGVWMILMALSLAGLYMAGRKRKAN